MKESSSGKEICLRIMQLRCDRGYSRECLAELSGISAKFLFEIERNQKGFSAKTLKNLSNALNVSTDYILTGRSGTIFEGEIAEELGKFDPGVLEKVYELLKIAYEIATMK